MIAILPEQHEKYQLEKDKIVTGKAARYRILEEVGYGTFSETYKAEIIDFFESDTETLQKYHIVTIKIPKLNEKHSHDKRINRLAYIQKQFLVENMGKERFKNLCCVARVLDYGTYEQINKKKGSTLAIFFLVQEFVDGKRLDIYMKSKFPSINSDFKGIPDAKCFFLWAKKLVTCLVKIHQMQIVHGDISLNNIMVNFNEEPIFIDFGQALFKDLSNTSVECFATHPFVAPEKSKSVGADIYSLGGVLFYLATGKFPPEYIQDIDELKNLIVKEIKTSNRFLYEENCGIADIIARCLRYSQHDRISHAEGVLQDIETFSNEDPFFIDINKIAKYINNLNDNDD
jgi:serine/threonine protein kinase